MSHEGFSNMNFVEQVLALLSESSPWLQIWESCEMGDAKTFIIDRRRKGENNANSKFKAVHEKFLAQIVSKIHA